MEKPQNAAHNRASAPQDQRWAELLLAGVIRFFSSRRAIVILSILSFGVLLQIPQVHAVYYNLGAFIRRSALNFDWPFTGCTDAQYMFGSSIELVGDVARLKASSQTDSSNTLLGFAGGSTVNGTFWDSTNTELRLAQTGTPTNTSQYSTSWIPQTVSILGYWAFDEVAGTTGAGSVLDGSGKGRNGTPSGVTFGVPGQLSTAASFNGTSSEINLGQIPLTGDATVSVWIKPGASQVSYAAIVSKHNTGSAG